MSERWFRDLGTGGSRRSGTVDPLRRNIHRKDNHQRPPLNHRQPLDQTHHHYHPQKNSRNSRQPSSRQRPPLYSIALATPYHSGRANRSIKMSLVFARLLNFQMKKNEAFQHILLSCPLHGKNEAFQRPLVS